MEMIRQMRYMARRFPTATALNFVGLTVALTAFYLCMTQVAYNHSYNRGLAGHERLYRLEPRSMWNDHGWMAHCNRMFAETVADMPQVEHVGLMEAWYGSRRFTLNGNPLDAADGGCSDDYLPTMGAQCLSGSLSWTKDDRGGVILPRSVALTCYGEVDVAGRYIGQTRSDSVLVRGVYADFADNCSARNCIYYNIGNENEGNFSNFNYYCYVRLKAGVPATGLEETLSTACYKAMRQFFVDAGHVEELEQAEQEKGLDVRLRLQPIAETWFSGVDADSDRGNRTVDLILRWACFLLAAIAAINLLNFTLAKAPMRVKGINTRRILGSSTTALRAALVGEDVAFALLAGVAALTLAALLAGWPLVADMATGSIALADHPGLAGLTLGVACLIGGLSGIYPAVFVTSFQPALALKGTFGLTPRGRQLRTALIALQLVTSGVMVVYLGIMMLQSHYIYHSDYGYAKDEVLYAYAGDINRMHKRDALRTELLGVTGIDEVGYSQFVIGTQDNYMGWGREDDDHSVLFTCMPCDWRYLRTLGIEVNEGHDFDEHDSDAYVINRRMKETCDWMEIGKPILKGQGRLAGVCDNVRYASIRVDRAETNLAFYIFSQEMLDDWGDPLSVVNVRVKAHVDKLGVMEQIRQTIDALGDGRSHDVFFLDQRLQYTYADEFRFIRQVKAFAIVCLIITLIGLFCLTLFETEYRRKEIGIRKVMGSSTAEILALLCRRYVWIIGCSFAIAAPIAWHVGHEWLQGFAERTPIHWWLFPAALAAVTLVTLLTVIAQSWRTANANPIDSIKTE